jgi:hypothetical protein
VWVKTPRRSAAKELGMRLLRSLVLPATESQLGLALAFSIVFMAIMLCGLVWQSGVIVYQRDLIRWMWNWKFGG